MKINILIAFKKTKKKDKKTKKIKKKTIQNRILHATHLQTIFED